MATLTHPAIEPIDAPGKDRGAAGDGGTYQEPFLDQKSTILATLAFLHPNDEVLELCIIGPQCANSPLFDGRAFGKKAIVAGWFRDHDKAATLASKILATGVYVTLNPCLPALRSRASERLIAGVGRTKDSEIEHIRNLLIDIDVIRPADISSTDAEHEAALEMIEIIRADLENEGWPDPLVGDSGNGGHLIIPVDLPNTQENIDLVKAVLKALSLRYQQHLARLNLELDQVVFNPARLTKLYGTMVRKGDNTQDRPHRLARIISLPETRRPVPVDLLERIAEEAELEAAPRTKAPENARGQFDVAAYLNHYNVAVVKVKPLGNSVLYCLEECVFDCSHTGNEAAIGQAANGTLFYQCFHDSCRGRKWAGARAIISGKDSLMDFSGLPDWRGPTPRRADPSTPGMLPLITDWVDLGHLPESPTPAVLSLPAELVPAPLAPWVQDVSERMCVPLELMAAPVLVSLGSLVGRSVGIHPKRLDDWLEVPNLWGVAVMRPGMLKTPTISEATKPLRDLARIAREEYEVAAQEADSRVAILEAKIDRMKATMRNPNKTSDEELYGLGGTLSELKQELREARVTERRYYTQDPTTEKLGELLRDNPRGLLVLRDELAGWLRTLDKPGREGDREFYLEGWDGKQDYTQDRIKRGTIHIPCHTISVFGGTQPGKLKAYIAGAINPAGDGDDGLLQRFQILVWPDEAPPWKNHDRVPNLKARDRAWNIFKTLDKLTPEDLRLDSPIPGAMPALRFDAEAQNFFDAWRDRLEQRLRSEEMAARPAFESHLAKYRSLMPILALLFYLIDWAAGLAVTPRVGIDHATLAAAWCDFLEMHAMKVYALEGPERAAQNLADRIREGKVWDGMSFREIYRHHWGGLDTPEKLRAAVEVLDRVGWVKVQDVASGAPGRPSPVLRINPKLGGRHE
jgi:hypothetical protein